MSLRKKLKFDTPEEDKFDNDAESVFFKESNKIVPNFSSNNISEKFLQIELELVSKLDTIQFRQPVECVYSPLKYAFHTHSMFVNKYCSTTKKLLFLGLNPGPWGMSQTGVPFGEVSAVRDWLKIEGPVQKPFNEISPRKVQGFECPRSEVSGKRIWGLFQALCGEPENFFKHAYMHNYCPIALMKNSGVNITPDDLKKKKRPEVEKLLEFCDQAIVEILKLLQVETVVAVGRFTEKRIQEILKCNQDLNINLLYLKHPSPRIPKNENWQEVTLKSLKDLNLLHYFQN